MGASGSKNQNDSNVKSSHVKKDNKKKNKGLFISFKYLDCFAMQILRQLICLVMIVTCLVYIF